MELKVIKNQKEVDLMIHSIIKTQKNPTTKQVKNDLQLIDDLLVLQRSRMLFIPKRTKTGKLRKDSTLKQIIEKRIELSLTT